MQVAFDGLFPRDHPRNTRFAINFFTVIGLGALTDELREWLKTAPKQEPQLPAEIQQMRDKQELLMKANERDEEKSSDSDDSSSSSSSSSSLSTDSSDSESPSESGSERGRTNRNKTKSHAGPMKTTERERSSRRGSPRRRDADDRARNYDNRSHRDDTRRREYNRDVASSKAYSRSGRGRDDDGGGNRYHGRDERRRRDDEDVERRRHNSYRDRKAETDDSGEEDGEIDEFGRYRRATRRDNDRGSRKTDDGGRRDDEYRRRRSVSGSPRDENRSEARSRRR